MPQKTKTVSNKGVSIAVPHSEASAVTDLIVAESSPQSNNYSLPNNATLNVSSDHHGTSTSTHYIVSNEDGDEMQNPSAVAERPKEVAVEVESAPLETAQQVIPQQDSPETETSDVKPNSVEASAKQPTVENMTESDWRRAISQSYGISRSSAPTARTVYIGNRVFTPPKKSLMYPLNYVSPVEEAMDDFYSYNGYHRNSTLSILRTSVAEILMESRRPSRPVQRTPKTKKSAAEMIASQHPAVSSIVRYRKEEQRRSRLLDLEWRRSLARSHH